MTAKPNGARAPAAASPVVSKLYFAAWRWHFYAGLYVIPFLLMLSATGALILWFTAIAPEYGDRIAIARGERALEAHQLLAEAEAHGLNTVDGLGMLLHQAVPGFAAWFGVTPQVTPQLRARIVATLDH